jgi:hypothetical protein
MKFEGKEFDGSDSIYKTNRLLQSKIGTRIWMTNFIPHNYDNRNFIELLLSKLSMMGLCCIISGLFPAFIAEMMDSYNTVTLYIAITNSIILDHILERNGRDPNFKIASFVFSMREDLWNYTVTFHGIS